MLKSSFARNLKGLSLSNRRSFPRLHYFSRTQPKPSPNATAARNCVTCAPSTALSGHLNRAV